MTNTNAEFTGSSQIEINCKKIGFTICEKFAKQYPINPQIYWEIIEGKRFFKLVIRTFGLTGGSAHAFIDKTNGNMYKAASWSAPAKTARYNVLIDIEKILEKATNTGAYLYAAF